MTPKEAPPRSRRVLLVEDDAATRSGIQALLREEGVEVASASDGHQALVFLRRAPRPALILLDLTMAGMSGWEFRREQLADRDLSDIPVVVMTGHRDYDDPTASLRASGHLQKPIRPDELRGVLERFFGEGEKE